MEFGIAGFPTHDGIGPAALARLLEERGYGWLFYSEHTHIPASRATPFPGGEPLSHEYSHNYDLFSALVAAASATNKLRVGTGICLIAQRDPIVTAKTVASIDHLSGGRMELGVGAGWNIEEMENHGVDPATRFARMREHIEAMRAIWTDREASYDGKFVSFDRIWSWPKPVQLTGPPVLLAGNGPRAVDRVLSHGDGWLPIHAPGLDVQIKELQGRAADAGLRRQIVVTGLPADAGEIERYLELGVDRVHFQLAPAPQGPTERALEQIEMAIAEALT